MDSALKQRLLGAAVLIALAIIFVPMFLGSAPPKQDNTTLNLDIPPPPERKFETRTLNVDATNPTPAPVATDSGAKSSASNPGGDAVVTVDTKAPVNFEAPDAGAPPSKPVPATPAPAKPVAPPATPAAIKPVVAPPPAVVAAASGRFSVNLGVYADRAHADALVAKLVKLGFAAYGEPTDYQGKAAQRVRVGPFSSRAGAETARLKIKQSDPKLPSSVAESADEAKTDAPAAALPANRAGGWAVQVGAFKSEAEANKLRDRLRNASIATFVDRSGNGDQQMWRVRAGPYVDRAGADSARAGIKQKFQIDGIIATQP